ncbi:MAG: hypothetical protein HFG48_01905 [Bacilli bacterium]|nr:hypothetical protein [Bacilli bacterium]
MYSYNYNVPNMNRNMRNSYNYNNQDRFFGTGFIAPLLIGGIAGYAIGNNNHPNNFYQYPVFIPNNPTYFNNNFIYYPF